MGTDEAWDILENELNVSDETLRIVTAINGYSMETLENVLYAVAGYNDFEQYKGESDEE